MGVFDSAVKRISNLVGISSLGQTTKANSLPVVPPSDWVGSFGGDIAHGSTDTGYPVSIGGRASSAAPTAVSTGQRVRAWFDLNGRLVVDVNGAVAHDAPDAGNPQKIGGKALSSRPSLVGSSDRVDAYFDQRGRLCVRVDAISVSKAAVTLTPSDPTMGGESDITNASGSAITSSDLTIRDTSQHRFMIPMRCSTYDPGASTATIYVKNSSSAAWDQTPFIQVLGHVGDGGGRGVFLAQFEASRTAGDRFMIGPGAVGLGGRIGASPMSQTQCWYQCDAIVVAPWYAIELRITFSVAPTQGSIDEITVIRA